MYYERYEKRPRRRRRRRGCLGALVAFLLKLTAIALVLAILAGVGLYWLPSELFMVEPDYELSLNDELPASPHNLLVLGVDVLDSGKQRSDTIMIASIERDTLKLTSVQRDTIARIAGHGATKINAAYTYGGAELAMRTVNETFETNIVHYVVVDFTALVRVVDALGGIEVDITEAEMNHINRNVLDSAKVFRQLGYTATELKEYGEKTHLDGLQALGYARIRKLDSDFKRTSRQRTVVDAMRVKMRANMWNPIMWARLIPAVMSGVETNLSPLELISLAEKAVLAGELEQLRLPVDGSFLDDGSSLTITNKSQNPRAFREFVYE